jgi:hypothetical protein
VIEQGGHVAGQEAQVHIPVDVGGAPVSLQLGSDHLAVGGQLGPDAAERKVDGQQPAVQQYQRPARAIHLVVHPQPVDRRVSLGHAHILLGWLVVKTTGARVVHRSADKG